MVFRFFNPQSEQNRDSVRRSQLLLWQLLMAPVDQIGAEIQREVCLAIRYSKLKYNTYHMVFCEHNGI